MIFDYETFLPFKEKINLIFVGQRHNLLMFRGKNNQDGNADLCGLPIHTNVFVYYRKEMRTMTLLQVKLSVI